MKYGTGPIKDDDDEAKLQKEECCEEACAAHPIKGITRKPRLNKSLSFVFVVLGAWVTGREIFCKMHAKCWQDEVVQILDAPRVAPAAPKARI